MQLINTQLLKDLGIQLAGEEEESLLSHLQGTLEERVGAEIIELLDEKQLEELVQLQQGNNEAELNTWLQANVPDLQQVVKDETDILLGELAEKANQI